MVFWQIQTVFQVAHGVGVTRLAAEFAQDFDGAAVREEGLGFKNHPVVDVGNARAGINVEKRLQYVAADALVPR